MNNEEWCKKNCPYNTDCACDGVCNFVLSLLKCQEAVEPKKESDDYPGSWWYVCGNCGGVIDWHDMYCRHCGQAVKWK